jgi:RHH-type rel operon transcriptional repressor/antitoxin RelB
MEKVNVTCRIPRDAIDSLDKLGAMVDRDRSYLINQAIGHYVAQQKWQIEEVERAIQEIEAGNFLTEKEFTADMKSWRKRN